MRLAVAASRGLAGRTARVAKALESLGADNASQRAAAAHAVFDAALGRQLPVTAGFRLSSTDGAAAEVEASLAVSGKRPGEEPGAHMHWLAQVAKVQPRAARLVDALLLRAGTGAGAVLELHTAQLPHVLVAGAPEGWEPPPHRRVTNSQECASPPAALDRCRWPAGNRLRCRRCFSTNGAR